LTFKTGCFAFQNRLFSLSKQAFLKNAQNLFLMRRKMRGMAGRYWGKLSVVK
jgi:hypothetical protein